MAATTDAIRDLIVADLGWPGDRRQLTDDYPLIDNEVIDSLGVFQIVTFLEAQYGIEVDDDELVPENFESLGAIAGLVHRKTGTP
ncbi:MAG: acyl carrier protein [Acidimicrobiales bacterium]